MVKSLFIVHFKNAAHVPISNWTFPYISHSGSSSCTVLVNRLERARLSCSGMLLWSFWCSLRLGGSLSFYCDALSSKLLQLRRLLCMCVRFECASLRWYRGVAAKYRSLPVEKAFPSLQWKQKGFLEGCMTTAMQKTGPKWLQWKTVDLRLNL